MKSHKKAYGILGGTFDPIHKGHLHAAQQLIKQLHLTQVRLVPCYQPSHRDMPTASAKDRLEMVKLATAGHKDLVADDREIRRQGITYTYDTLKSLKQEFPNETLYLIIGVDAFQHFDQWHKWQEIPSLAQLVVINRPNYQLAPSPILAEFVDIDPLPISATQVRKRLLENKDVTDLLPEKVYEYIVRKGLYS